MKRAHPESELQQACVKYFRMQFRFHALYLFAIPNGGIRSRLEASIMQGEGVTPGVADLFLALPSGPFHGLFIEIKSPKGRISENQAHFFSRQRTVGYQCQFCNSIDGFISIVNDYMKHVT